MIKKIFKYSMLISLGLVVNMEVQAEKGVYIDGNAGYGLLPGFSPHRGGFAYNGDIGYQLNNYFGLELGYNHFANVPYPYASKGNYSGDLALKGILPLAERWNLFGKLGLAYVHSQQKFSNFSHINNNLTTNFTYGSVSGPAPYLAAGVSYKLSQQFDINAQIHGTPGTHVPEMYAALIGLSYHFK